MSARMIVAGRRRLTGTLRELRFGLVLALALAAWSKPARALE